MVVACLQEMLDHPEEMPRVLYRLPEIAVYDDNDLALFPDHVIQGAFVGVVPTGLDLPGVF